jgi:ribonuclease R
MTNHTAHPFRDPVAPTPSSDLLAAAHRAMIANGFEPDFPPEVEREVATLLSLEPEAASREVRDLRGLLWSSIDNRESRDLDQVEVAERLPSGEVRVLIGIADVDALVPKGSATDAHAAENTTSVYAGVVVFPMLPERLSTDLTSLNQGEDRLAIVIEMHIAPDGTVTREDVYRALVRNRAKLVYESIGAWLDGSGPPPRTFREIPGLEAQLRLQHEAAQRLRDLRRRSGALDFETIEARPVIAGGKVIDLEVVRRNQARDIIENYMVAANSAMARFLGAKRVPSIRRVVRTPKRWERIVAIAADLGVTLPPTPDNIALANFLERRRSEDPEHFPDLSLSVVKLLGPGEYILERRMGVRQHEGHFGLALAEYTHSTAPNRRFPDLVTQRLVKSLGEAPDAPYADDELMRIARHCTEQEDAAKKVERLIRKQAAAVLMADRIGESFAAMVTGASQKGTYVRLLRPPVEGRVVRGARGLDVGDTVRVTLLSANPKSGFIDFEHGGKEADTARKLERSRRKKLAAVRLAARVGERFNAVVTGASPSGTWVRLADGSAEGKVVRGQRGLAPGQRVQVVLVSTDAVHGFIDFEYEAGVDERKRERTARKRRRAEQLQERIGEEFDAVVTGVNQKATYVRLAEEGAEGRLVRGRQGLGVGSEVRVVLLATDAERGWIDFAKVE